MTKDQIRQHILNICDENDSYGEDPLTTEIQRSIALELIMTIKPSPTSIGITCNSDITLKWVDCAAYIDTSGKISAYLDKVSVPMDKFLSYILGMENIK